MMRGVVGSIAARGATHIWILGLWAGAFVVVQVVAAIAWDPVAVALPVALLPAAVAVAVVVLRSRMADWLVQVSVAALAVQMLANTAMESSDVQMVSSATAMLVPVVYVGLWNKPVLAHLYAALGALGFLWIVIARGWSADLAQAWVTITAMLFGMAFVLAVFIRRTTHLAYYDHLTGLMNRTGLSSYLRTHEDVGRATLPRILLVADLDGLKETNDTFGHAAGDEVLLDLARAWRSVLRPDDVAVRLGGDEFLLILPQTPLSAAADVIRRLRSKSTVPWSVGVADWPAGTPFDVALAKADAGLYADKEARRPVAVRRRS